jgi:4-amino-4-deoxy-L-arabinose transferase-like glycosyltransferase
MQRRSAGPHSGRRTVSWLLAAIVAVAAVARFWGLRFGLPHTYTRPDETVIIDVALQFLRGNFQPAFYDYPWLYMWTVAGLYLLYYVWGLFTGLFNSVADVVAGWRSYWIPFFVINRALSAALGTATVLVVFRIARRLWDETTGLVAALFIALAFLHVRDSHYGTTDTMMTFLVMWSMSFLLEAHFRNRRRDFVVAGFIGGLAAATKYNALLLAAPIAASYLLNIFEQAGRRGRAVLDPRLLLYGAPFLMGLAIGVPFLAFDFPAFQEHMKLLGESLQGGVRGIDLSHPWIHHLEYSLRYGLGLPLLGAGLAGCFAILAFQPRVGIVLLSFPIAYYIVAGTLKYQFFRYAIPMVPFLCIAAARLVTWTVPAATKYVLSGLSRTNAAVRLTASAQARASLAEAASLRRPKADTTTIAQVLTAAMAIGLVLPSAISVFYFDRIMSRTDNRVVVARWFDEHVPSGSSVLMSGSIYGYVQFTRDMDYNAWVWDRRRHIFVTDLDKRPGVGRPEWILVQDSPLHGETQPIVVAFLRNDYEFVKHFGAFSRRDGRIYDQQDAFFVPFAGFRGVERPGPNYSLYKRISVQ